MQAALRIAFENHGARNNHATAEHLHETEFELRSLQIMTQRMILTQEEMVCFFKRSFLFSISSLFFFYALMWFSVFILGRSCSKEVLACSVLGFVRSTWYSHITWLIFQTIFIFCFLIFLGWFAVGSRMIYIHFYDLNLISNNLLLNLT